MRGSGHIPGVLAAALLVAAPMAADADDPTGSAATPAAAAVPIHGSLSCGFPNRGALAGGVEMPPKGDAWVVPPTWQERGFQRGSDELVGVIQRAARKVAERYPGSILGVADLSKRGGGAIPHHRSHQSGRDGDLLYYAIDGDGGFVAPDDLMPVYRPNGKATYSKAPRWQKRIPVRYFDLERNWALLEALITDEQTEVTHVFVARRIRTWLIRYAREAGKPDELMKRANEVLQVPRNVSSHDDHMHIRVACGAADIAAGRCRDGLAPRRKTGSKKWFWNVPCPPKVR